MRLLEECEKGADRIGVDLLNPTYKERLERELSVIVEKEFDDYFLIWADIVRWAEGNGIMVGPGRGCLKGNSPILTKDGFIPIKDVEINSEVMAHDGEYHRVVNRFKYDNTDPMIKIRTYYDAQGISVTPDHKMLVSRMNSDPSPQGRRFAEEPSPVEWVEANMVEEGDMLVIPRVKLDEKVSVIDLGEYAPSDSEIGEEFICEKIGGNQHHKAYSLLIPRYIRVDYSLGFFLGFWSANGWFAKTKPNLIGLCCNKDDNDGSIHDLMFSLFNLIGSEFPHKTKHVVQFEFRSKTIKTFVKRLVPEYSLSAKTKTLAGFNLSWNKEYLKGLVDGAWDGDGTFSPKTKWGKTAYSSTSQTLVRQLRQVLWSLGVPTSLRGTYRKETRKNWGGDRIEYTLVAPPKIYGEVKNQMGYVDDEYIYQRVFKIEEEEPELFVYDIEVENKHSFVTESYTVHNSAAGSLVSYLLGITKIDPIEHGLFFERFLDVSRPDLPDIDVDFQASRRPEVFKYVQDKYGEEYTARIATFSHFYIKQILRDLCRIFSIPMKTSNKLGSVIPNGYKTVEDALEFPEVEEFFNNYPLLKELAEDMTGAIRQKSVHAAGMIITPEPIRDFMSLEKVKGELCTCFDMAVIDAMRILKLDILGLKTLDIIAKALELAGIDQDVLPKTYDDPRVYEVFQEGNTLGVFQFKSQLLTNLGKKLGIADFKTLYAATTIARPGPLHSGEAEKYISRHNGDEGVSYLHNKMVSIAEDTYGLILYQEQIMQISQQMAEFTTAESNVLRKVIGKSKGKDAIDEYMDKFISGCINEQIEKSIAEEIWNIIREAGAYSFNKCLTGDTILYRGSAGRHSGVEITIEELYQNWNSKSPVGEKYRDPNRGITICALDSDGRIRPKKIKGVYPNGIKSVYEITTEAGRKIRATENHRFLDSNFEWKEVYQFNAGDYVAVMGETETVQVDERKKWNYTGLKQENKKESCPGKEGFQKGELNPGYINGQYVLFKKAQSELLEEGRSCRICNKERKRMELHHIDGNHHNNERENITLLCVSCHKKEEYKLGRRKRWERGRLVETEKIISIKYIGEEKVYDLEMDTPEHNFIANGFISHNSHAVSYSAVSYWCAWLRTYYPKEWLVAVMNYEEDNIQADAVRELRRIGADILPPSINYSTENVQIAEDGKIYMGLRDVEGCGEKAVKNIISEQPYTSFDNFLSRVTRRTVNKRVVANLIQAGAFDEFGEQRVDLYDTITGPGETDHQYWDEKEQLRRQIMVLDMPAAKPLIDYYPNKYEQKVDITPMRNIEFGDKTPEIWVKGIITDFTPKLANSHGVAVVGEPNMAYFDLDDGSKKVSCFIAPEQLYLFKHILSDGEPVLLKTHTFGNTEKLYVDGVLNLEKDEQNSPVLEKYAFGITEEERQTTQGTNVSIVSYANYYISKNGNPYVRIITTDEDNLLLFKGFDNQPFLPGEIIAWNTNKLPFINLERRII